MGYDLERFSSGSMDKGVSARSMDFQAKVTLGIDGYNMSQGIQQGLGPRPGMSIIPGQADHETLSIPRLPGLLSSEFTNATGYSDRVKVLGVYAIQMASPADVKVKITAYAWLLTSQVSTDEYFDVKFASEKPGFLEISSKIYSGFYKASAVTPINYDFSSEALLGSASVTPLDKVKEYLKYTNGTNFVSSSFFTVTGPNVPMQWMAGYCITPGAVTTAPNVDLTTIFGLQPVGTTTGSCGIPTEYNLQNFTTNPRNFRIFCLKSDATLNMTYTVAMPVPSATYFKQNIKGTNGVVSLDVSSLPAVKETGGTTYSDNIAVVINDNTSVTNSSYKAVLTAARNPFVFVFQDAYSTALGTFSQTFDLTQNAYTPRNRKTLYSQDGVKTNSCFNAWPDFVRGTPMAPTPVVSLGTADSGILRLNTVYEFCYSVYNKRLNFETNVGMPVKIQTGADDFVGLQLWTGGATDTIYSDYAMGTLNALFPEFTSTTDPTIAAGNHIYMNMLEYRFYYRQEGTFEWLPALYIDAAKYWLYPFGGQLMACTGPIAALPAGQPGGFNDYSPLAKDNYTCVLQYKNRAFWFSEKQINFSLKDNIFAYPARNSISAVSGEFKGGILHNYPGQAEQSSRLVIFGTRETYVARFTGLPQQANVQVSADTSGIFNIDGSDLVIDPWTSVTAFSYRSAVVAEGLLYWWGPQGFFRDDGVQTPTRISQDIEPDIFSIYDPGHIEEITANYNNQTKEIEWFFTPKTPLSGEVTHSLIFNTISGNWTPGSYNQKIDWLQAVTVETPIGTAGYREVVGSRLTDAHAFQRAYFFDQKNRSGDLPPTNELVIKSFTTPSAGVRRLTLATGVDATNFATIAAGDLIASQQFTAYTGDTGDDMICTVAAVNASPAYIDVILPTDATFPATGTYTYDKFFPVWHATRTGRGLNGFAYRMATNYWLPKGPNGYFFWLYAYLLAKMTIWKNARADGWDLSYRCPTAAGLVTDFIPFANNSDGNFQVYHPLQPGNDNQEGQGIKFILSGVHIGNEWVLQYMEAHGTPIKGDPLKRFEG